MSLAEIKYSNTKEENTFLEPLKPELNYNLDQEWQDTLRKVLARLTDMRWARANIDNLWSTFQLIADNKYYPYKDWRARSSVPVLRSLLELFVSEATTRKIDKQIEPVWYSDVDKAEVMKIVWDYDWNKNNRDEDMTEAEYKCWIFWTCAYFTWFEKTSRIINDPITDDKTWEMTFKKKLMEEGRIILRTLDMRNVYFDDRVTRFQDSNDQIYIEYLTPEQFKAEKGNKELKNLEYVWGKTKDFQSFYTYEDRGKKYNNLVEKLHYWNKQADRYIVIYNRSIIWRDTPIPYAHKELPIVPRQYWYVNDSIYWRWLAEACMQFLDKINKLSEMIYDWLARSNNSVFAMWNGLTFDWQNISFNNQFIKFNWQLNDTSFREIKGIPPNQAAFTYLQDLLKEIAIYIWIDISQIVWQASSTAFETAVRTESSLKRVNVVLTNRDYALNKVFKRHLANIMQFFPISEAQRILEIMPDWTVQQPEEIKHPNILIEWKKYNPDNWKFVEMPWKFDFECKPEYIRWQVDITVKTNFNTPTLKSIKQDNMNKFLNDFNLYNQTVMWSPELKNVLKPDDFIKQLANTYDIDLKSIWWFEDSISKEWEKIDKIIMQMWWVGENNWMLWDVLPWMWQPQWWQPQEQTKWQSPLLPNVNASWWRFPWVTAPQTPTINGFNPAEKSLM